MITEKLVSAMVQRIVENYVPEKVIVFGSWARGEANGHSDVDLLVIIPYKGDKRDIQASMRLLLRDFRTPVDIIIASPEEIAERQHVNGLIYRPAIGEGMVLYERSRAS